MQVGYSARAAARCILAEWPFLSREFRRCKWQFATRVVKIGVGVKLFGGITMWYLVLSRSLPEKEEDKQRNYEDHRQWLDDQHRAGRLMFSGPTTDGRYGVYIMLATNLEEAKALAATDPHHQRGIREMDVLEWRAHRAFRLDKPTIADVEAMARAK
jgi:uncharacterized protein YciI